MLGAALQDHRSTAKSIGAGSTGCPDGRLVKIRFPLIQDVLELLPLEIDVQSAEFHRGEFLNNPGGDCAISHAFVCMEDDTLSLNAGLSLQQHLRNQPVHISVVQWEDGGFAELMEKATPGNAKVSIFGLLNHTCQNHLLDDGTHERLALLHRQCLPAVIFKPAPGESLKGSAHVDWEELG